MSSRTALIAGILFLVFLLSWLLMKENSSSEGRDYLLVGGARSIEENGDAALSAKFIRQSLSPRLKLNITDMATGAKVIALRSLGLQSVKTRLDVLVDDPEAGNVVESFLLKSGDKSVSYEVPTVNGFSTYSSPVENLIWSATGNSLNLALPFLSHFQISARNSVTKLKVDEISVSMSFVSEEGWRKYTNEVATLNKKRISPYPSNHPDPILAQYKSLCEEDGFPIINVHAVSGPNGNCEVDSPVSGIMIAKVNAAGFSSTSFKMDVSPGPLPDVVLELAPKPVLHGKVVSTLPSSEYSVNVSVLLSNDGSDFSGDDHRKGFSLTGKRDANGVETRVARSSFKLDKSGSFAAEMPSGSRYLLEIVHPSGEYYSEELTLNEIVFSEAVPLEWIMEGKLGSENPGISFQIYDSEGLVARNAKVLVQPFQDYPWFRVYPEITCDEFGRGTLPWGNPNDKMVVAVFLEKGGGEVFTELSLSSNMQIHLED
ncbi:MAG: hypothetical protein QM477_07525 [Planctomycetota bacterium]